MFATPSDSNDRRAAALLSKRCFACHGPNGEEGLVRFDRRDDMVDRGAIVPGEPDGSELLRRVASTDPDARMPPKGDRLSAAQVEQLRRWIAQGADFEEHWAFRPLAAVPPPSIDDATWPRQPLDRFVLARLEEAGLQPAPEAEPRALIRRLTLDLTGLPPTPAEIEAFLLDRAPDAYERMVDRLLTSPQYGERSAQHWLDVAPFARHHQHSQSRKTDTHSRADTGGGRQERRVGFDRRAERFRDLGCPGDGIGRRGIPNAFSPVAG